MSSLILITWSSFSLSSKNDENVFYATSTKPYDLFHSPAWEKIGEELKGELPEVEMTSAMKTRPTWHVPNMNGFLRRRWWRWIRCQWVWLGRGPELVNMNVWFESAADMYCLVLSMRFTKLSENYTMVSWK